VNSPSALSGRVSGQFVRFLVVGAAGTVLNMAVFTLLTDVAGAHYSVSCVVAFLCAVTSNYYWNRRWTFQWGGRPGAAVQYARFVVVAVVALGVNLLVLTAFVEGVGLDPKLGQLAGIAAGTLCNFIGSKLWVFAERRRESKSRWRRLAAFGGFVLLVGALILVFCPLSELVPIIRRLRAPGADLFAVTILAFTGMTLLVVGVAGRALGVRLGHLVDWLERRCERPFVLGLLSVGLLLRLCFAALLPSPLQSVDATCYHDRAVLLAEGEGYVRRAQRKDGQEILVPTAYWPVGYPAFLAGLYAVVGPSWRAGILVNALLSTVSLALLYCFGKATFGLRAARLAAVGLTVYLPQFPHALMSEALFEVLLLLALLIAVRVPPRWYAALLAGIVLAAATFTKSGGLLFFSVLFVVWWARSGRLGRPAALTLLTAVVVAAGPALWAARNARAIGTWVPFSTNGGQTLIIGANDGANGKEQCPHCPTWYKVNDIRVKQLDEVRADRYAKAEAWKWIRKHPIRWVALGFVKVGWMTVLNVYTSELHWLGLRHRHLPACTEVLKGVRRVLYWLVLAGFLVYCVRLLRHPAVLVSRRQFLPMVPLLAFAYMAAQSFVFYGNPRFRTPIESLMLLAAAAIVSGWRPIVAVGKDNPLDADFRVTSGLARENRKDVG
jgi:putative flippase GtrA/4-amino-4-deoxy-L-arabinose transferase-like glycosyltransferase